ncbi:MAG TPA: PAS domain S-box protein, partial [Candidatus Methylacidiphilales bacterium]|nr:PAS domain S-box protein [Candidatus Methylacidiphilales bacterium]
CGHTIQQRELFIIPDARRDERFANNPLVKAEPNICFYAGAPLVNEDNIALGALCVMDHQPHTLSQAQKEMLQILARQVMTHLELHRHSHKLIESEERLRLVTNNARLGLVVVDRDRRYIYANDAYCEILGLPTSDIVGKRVPDVLTAVYDEQIRPRLDRAFSGERVAYELHKPDVSTEGHYYEVRYEPTKTGDTVTLVIVVIANITERKLAELSVKRLAAIVEYSEDAIISKDLNGIITSWNQGAQTIFGYSAEEMIGLSILRLIPEERQSEEAQILASIARGESVNHFETQRRTKDGRLIDVSVTASPLKDASGKPIGVSKVARDITRRKKAEMQIAEQAAFLDKARDAILVQDLEGRILFWNKGAERIYGWASHEVLDRNIGELLYSVPAKFQELNRQTIDQGEWNGELQHLTKDRREIIVEARWTLIRNDAGRPKSILAINTDITEKKKIETQFMRAQRMESIGTLAGGVAHDLNNILSPILLSIEVLKIRFNQPEAKIILDTIEVSARRGADIVRQVLSFARGVEGERIEIQPKHLLKDLQSIVKDTFPKDIRLAFSVPHDSWTILGDPTQVHQVLLNLCVNARDAMPHGGNLSLLVENCHLDEQYAAMNIQAVPGCYVVISVVDSGTGMSPDVIDKIFEPFFTTKAPNKGTGLGLSTVMAVVKSHGGFVNVYSEPGKGTTFKVYLPARDKPSEGGAEVDIIELPRGNGETILLVDDEASVLTITSQTLQAFGYKVLTSTDGADALAVYVQHRHEIALVLADMMMPIMDGPSMIYALKRVNSEVKIIAASGLNTHENAVKASGAGIQHFLTKPYTARTLLKTVRAVLDEPAFLR